MAKDNQNVFYVNINEPVEVHRAVLESTKQILGNLKRYEYFKKIRTYKLEYLMQLKHVMGEINLLVNRLSREMPKTGLRAAKVKAAVVIVPRKVKAEAAHKPVKEIVEHKSKIDLLEEDLNDIESRLKILE